MNINFELYKLFYYVAKNQNITKTANELSIAQPWISKSIKNLEDQLGCKLFIRNKSGVFLTEEGKVLYENIKVGVEIMLHSEQKLLEVLNLDSGTFHIGVSKTLMKKYLLSFVKEFHLQYPNIKIHIHTDPTSELIVKARNGLVDLIILNLPYRIPNDFEKVELRTIHDCFVASPQYVELKNKVIALNDLKHYPLIFMAKGSNTRYFIDDFCDRHHIHFTPEMELASYSLVTEFVKLGFGIGMVTKEYLDKEIEKEELFELSVEPKLPPRMIGAIYLKDKSLSCCSRMFLNMLLKENS